MKILFSLIKQWKLTSLTVKNIVSTDDSVEMQITDSISENLTDSDLESRYFSYSYLTKKFNIIVQNKKKCITLKQYGKNVIQPNKHNFFKCECKDSTMSIINLIILVTIFIWMYFEIFCMCICPGEIEA